MQFYLLFHLNAYLNNLLKNFYTFFSVIISILVVTLLWKNVTLPLNYTNGAKDILVSKGYKPTNDTIRYIFLNNLQNKIKKYYSGLSPWSDRNYFNKKNDEKLKDLYLIQIPRHYKDDIYLKVTDEVIIFRVLCKKNNNTEYINWERENYELEIIGTTCVHTNIVKKKFKKRVIKITAGGPISSDPIFIYNSKSGE